MATSPTVTDELSCSICLELFDHPLLLPCAHTFCRNCLREFCAKQQTGDVTTLLCPKCRASVKLGPEGIDGLPKNTTLANIILSFEEEGQRQRSLPPCDVCDSSPPRPGFKSCSDCTLTFCRACFAQLHPIRGAFTHHVITSPAPSERKKEGSEVESLRTPRSEKRVVSALQRVRSMSPVPKEQEYIEKMRKSITRKKKELKNILKEAQDLLKTTEEETEDQMKQIKTVSSKLHEGVAEKEGAMLAQCTRRRHDAVTCCYDVISDAQAQTSELDVLEEKFGEIIMKGPIMDISHELSCLEERLATLTTVPLDGRLDDIPRPRQLQPLVVKTVLRDLDFKTERELAPPVITEVSTRPVSRGPAVIDVKWTGALQGFCYRLVAHRKTQKGRTERVILDDVTEGSQLMLLPGIDAQYRLLVAMAGKEGEETLPGAAIPSVEDLVSEEKLVRTLPYVNCITLRFDPAFSHKAVAVTSSREQIMHRKCKLANLHDTLPPAPWRRLEELEGATADNPLPNAPHMYWECVIHVHVISRLDDAKLLADVGVCRGGLEDACGLLCDNPKAYSCYLVQRGPCVKLELWDGPRQEIVGRGVTVLDLQRDNEKTLRLGFYLDVARKVFAVVNPAASSLLASFALRFTCLTWLAALYCPDQVHATVTLVTAATPPTVLARLLAKP